MTMSVDSAASSTQDDGIRAATASQDGDRRAEHAVPQQAGQNDARAQQRPESLTREEYADAVRESGPPIQRSWDAQQADGSEPRSRADLDVKSPAGREPAEPHDREAHGIGMRADLGEIRPPAGKTLMPCAGAVLTLEPTTTLAPGISVMELGACPRRRPVQRLQR